MRQCNRPLFCALDGLWPNFLSSRCPPCHLLRLEKHAGGLDRCASQARRRSEKLGALIGRPGSGLRQTAVIRDQLPRLIAELGITSVLDIPCGGMNWMQHVDLGSARYLGADIVESMIAFNTLRYASPTRQFRVLDVAYDQLPRVDLIFCRDCLVHLSNRLVRKALAQIVQSRSTYLLTTTFSARTKNHNIPTGKWRPLNLCAAPFNLPGPARVINEGNSDASYSDKSLGL